jgi:hypothetical protein
MVLEPPLGGRGQMAATRIKMQRQLANTNTATDFMNNNLSGKTKKIILAINQK